MYSEEISTGVRTVSHLGFFFDELKESALPLTEQVGASDRGYFTPDEENAVRALLVSYWQSRSALFELITSFRADEQLSDEERQRAFLVALAAAMILVDAARFIREQFDDRHLLRRKWNEAAPEFGIPGGTYDAVQKSLLSARHAWHLYHAHVYFQEHQAALRALAADGELAPVLAIIDRLLHRLDVSVARFAKTKLRVRSGQVLRGLGRTLVLKAIYGLQKLVSGSMAGVYVRRGHEPGVPAAVADELRSMLVPGDVLVVRKEYAVTNYFLPGYWPHAALYLGNTDDLTRLGLDQHVNVQPRWRELLEESGATDQRVLESMKDGVQLRFLESPFASDSIIVLRPQLSPRQVSDGLARGLTHEGKPYDFGFDFSRSDRLVCTEVVYRSYDGIGGVRFPLRRRVGRPTFSGGDLVQMAIDREHFEPLAAFAPTYDSRVLSGTDAHLLLQQAQPKAC